MKPVMQASTDDCLSACIASILELDIIEVPRFIDSQDENGGYLTVFNGFLGNYNLQALTLFLSQLDQIWVPEGYHLIYGISPRMTKHAVVGYKGEMAHDPHPTQSGLMVIESYTVFVATLDKDD